MALATAVQIALLLQLLSAVHTSPAVTTPEVSPWAITTPELSTVTPWAICTAPNETICTSDCSQVVLCLGDGTGGYIPTVVATCESNTRCSTEQADCVAKEDSDCHPPADFACHDVGFFPDPYDCQRFHVCTEVNADSESFSCSGATAYNPLTADCSFASDINPSARLLRQNSLYVASLTKSDRVCTEGPVVPCSQPGQIGIVPENPAIYYICVKQEDEIVPEMYRCPGSQIFDTAVAA
ncbi:uncharacterized protein LOC124795990 [Schistocerca piceifrons]|uniref:uncharacterized protein LOC124795990 n=1 Tax=Schistocerca piceifrons TaxID=274613 RepID=UPI001F5F3D1E|nr:uncharacterized protein LOC124795990 [Schistocerca piceifrons]